MNRFSIYVLASDPLNHSAKLRYQGYSRNPLNTEDDDCNSGQTPRNYFNREPRIDLSIQTNDMDSIKCNVCNTYKCIFLGWICQ